MASGDKHYIGVKSVQRGVVDETEAKSNGYIDVTISTVDINKTITNVCPWVFYSDNSTGNDVSDLSYTMNGSSCWGVLTNSTNLRIFYNSTITSKSNAKFVWEIIEFY